MKRMVLAGLFMVVLAVLGLAAAIRWGPLGSASGLPFATNQAIAANGPTVSEPGWRLTRTVSLSGGRAAHYNPIDGLLYVGRRGTGSDGLYRIEGDGSTTQLASGSNVAGVVIDPDDGDIFFAEDYGGVIYRTAFDSTGRSTWVSGFHSGDDDPVGMAIAPNGYTGDVINPGDALVVDRGISGPDEVWRFSPDTAEGETVVHADNGTLINPVDITIGIEDVYLVDTGEEEAGSDPGLIYRVGAGGSLTLLSTSESIEDPVGIATDPITGDLFVLDGGGQRLVRVDPATGTVSDMFTGFSLLGWDWAGVDVTPDGGRIIITDDVAGAIYTFTYSATVFGIDVDPYNTSASTATSLGTIERCIRVDYDPTGDTDQFDVDVFLDNVPVGQDLVGGDWYMYYDQSYLQVNGWVGPSGLGCRDWLLNTQAGSALCEENGDTVFPDTDGTLNVSMVDVNVAAAEQPGALGVLDRYEMEVVAPGPRVVAITFAPAPTYLVNSAAQRYDPDMVWDGNHSLAYGLIAIDTDCPLNFGIDMNPYNRGGNGPLLPAAYSTQCACYDGETQPCACESGAQCLNDFDDDSDDVSNDGCGLGQIDACVRVDSGTFNIDVFVDNIPTGKDLAGFQYFLNYDNSLLRVNNRVPASGAPNWLLGAVPGSSVSQYGNNSWPHTTGSMGEAAADGSLAAGGEPAGSLGPIERYGLEVVGAGPAITALTLTPAPNYLVSNIPTVHEYNPDEVFDGNHVGPYGLVAIGQDCPPDSDSDNWFDPFDNCADDYNPDQQDVDTDGTGDLCDPDHQDSSAVSDPVTGEVSVGNPEGTVAFDGWTAEGSSTITIVEDAAAVGTVVSVEMNATLVGAKFSLLSSSALTGSVTVKAFFDPGIGDDELALIRVTKEGVGALCGQPGSPCEVSGTGPPYTEVTIEFGLEDDADLTVGVPQDSDNDQWYDHYDINDNGSFDEPNEHDNCPLVSNPLQEDFDDDAAGDACDCDSDNGGTPDGQEVRDGTDPLDETDDEPLDTADDDSDGALNWEEFWCGTDPDDECGDDCTDIPPYGTDDAWLFDVNIDCWVNSSDIIAFPQNISMPIQQGVANPKPFQCRFDVAPDAWINSSDIIRFSQRLTMPASCTPP